MKAIGIVLTVIGSGALLVAALAYDWKVAALVAAVVGGLIWLLNSGGNETG